MNKKQKLRKEADKLWKEVCFNKYGIICEVCNKEAVHIHHYFPRGLYSFLRYEVDNGIPLCFHCHFSKTHKGDPTVHEIIKKKRGIKWFNRLLKKSKEKHYSFQTIGYYQRAVDSLKSLLKEL